MVGTRESWEAFLEEDEEDESAYQKAIRVAEVEIGPIESAHDLITLWASLRRAPILEDRIGACGCDDCNERIYYGE